MQENTLIDGVEVVEPEFYELTVQPDFKMYHKDDFGIYKVQLDSSSEVYENLKTDNLGFFTIKGSMPELAENKKYIIKVSSKVSVDKMKRESYEVKSIYEQRPTTIEEQKTFLKVLLTEKQIENIFDVYPNQNVLELIEQDKFDYNLVKGIGESTYAKIRTKVIENKKYQQAIIELSEAYGLSHKSIVSLTEEYGSPEILIEKVKTNPYILADEVKGIGFKKADAIALNNGMKKDSDMRIMSCIEYTMKQEASSGHSWLSKLKLASATAKELAIPMKLIKQAIENIEDTFKKRANQVGVGVDVSGGFKSIIQYELDAFNRKLDNNEEVVYVTDGNYKELGQYYIDNDKVALMSNFIAELQVVLHIHRLLSVEDNFQISNIDSILDNAEKQQGFPFTDEQRDGVHLSVSKNVIVINGKAGSGKTASVKGLVSVLSQREDFEYATCALSGKASQRIQESSGLKSSTIHRLLNYHPKGGFQHNEAFKLPHDVIILDEGSMADSILFRNLIRSIKTGAKLIILGDVGQLESIGIGSVLKDLIESDIVPSIELTKVHRQAQRSGILSCANMVREGKSFVKKNDYSSQKLGDLKDLHYYPTKDKGNVVNRVLALAEKYKGDILDFQVLVPMKNRGDLSTSALNDKLQDIFNPDEIGKPLLKVGKKQFRQGDKVIQTVNNYDIDVFNGTIGIIEHVEPAMKTMIIRFEGVGVREYGDSMLKELEHAYALTGHKSQGSQWKYVVVAFDFSCYMMLSRQLAYTMMTRASQALFLIVEVEALLHAIKTDKTSKRNTFTKLMLNK